MKPLVTPAQLIRRDGDPDCNDIYLTVKNEQRLERQRIEPVTEKQIKNALENGTIVLPTGDGLYRRMTLTQLNSLPQWVKDEIRKYAMADEQVPVTARYEPARNIATRFAQRKAQR